MAADQARQRKPYDSPRRAEHAIATRRAVLDAARELFIERGYAVTTVADIARRARVAVDTVYAAVGRKPALLREVLETAISGSDQAVPAGQRDYVARVRAAQGARQKIQAYAAALVDIQPRLAPVYLALRDAAATDPGSAATWREISQRRARNMRAFAADLRATGELRTDLSDDDIADIVLEHERPRVLDPARQRPRLVTQPIRRPPHRHLATAIPHPPADKPPVTTGPPGAGCANGACSGTRLAVTAAYAVASSGIAEQVPSGGLPGPFRGSAGSRLQ